MAPEAGFWGRALEKAKQAKAYLLDRLAEIAWLLLLSLVLSVVAIKIVGLEDAWGTLVSTLCVGAMLAVVGQNFSHRYKQFATSQDRLDRDVGLLRKTVRKESGLLSMAQALRDLDQRLHIEAGDDVVIEHLGIHMEHSRAAIAPLLKRIAAREGVGRVHYRLLMLRRPKGRKSRFPPAIESLLDIAAVNARMIEEALAELNRTLPNFSGELCFYCEIPVIHGFRLRKPIKAAYVAIARWSADSNGFDAATGNYHRIDSPEIEAQGDLMAVFDAYFRHHWEAGGGSRPARFTPALQASPRTAPAVR